MIENKEQIEQIDKEQIDKEVLFHGAKDFLAAMEFIKVHANSTYLKFSNNSAHSAMYIKKGTVN